MLVLQWVIKKHLEEDLKYLNLIFYNYISASQTVVICNFRFFFIISCFNNAFKLGRCFFLV